MRAALATGPQTVDNYIKYTVVTAVFLGSSLWHFHCNKSKLTLNAFKYFDKHKKSISWIIVKHVSERKYCLSLMVQF